MKVISCKVGEAIQIGDEITVNVAEIRDNGRKVRLGIEAPLSMPVHRLEVYEAIKRQNQKAGQ